ncbi:hypothetical protein V3C99_005889 [Haemonchus contortus]|uniref:DUF4258 domain-containing protein n=1 Tax=Haemonchus contortus TaxID=6289 RepID=A0A7I4XUW5_HAECO
MHPNTVSPGTEVGLDFRIMRCIIASKIALHFSSHSSLEQLKETTGPPRIAAKSEWSPSYRVRHGVTYLVSRRSDRGSRIGLVVHTSPSSLIQLLPTNTASISNRLQLA